MYFSICSFQRVHKVTRCCSDTDLHFFFPLLPSLRDASGIADYGFQLDEAFDDATGPPWRHLEDVDEPVETSTSPHGNAIINSQLPRMQHYENVQHESREGGRPQAFS